MSRSAKGYGVLAQWLIALGVLILLGSCGESAKRVLDWKVKDNGFSCRVNDECKSLYCADGKKCAPKDDYGIVNVGGNYCHHNNHCASKTCECEQGGFGFCKEWEKWVDGQYDARSAALSRVGYCLPQRTLGAACRKGEDCAGFQAGQTDCVENYCAPRNGKGAKDAYCHHDDHCGTGVCRCPEGRDGRFCKGYKDRVAVKSFLDQKTGFICR